MKTEFLNPTKIQRKSFVVDAQGKVLGHLAQAVAKVLRGKDNPFFTPHLDCGNRVIIFNAEKIIVTGRKLKQKTYTRYSGYPGGLRKFTLETFLKEKPEEVVLHAVRGMLPRTPLGEKCFKKLRVYRGSDYPKSMQKGIQVLSL